MNTFKLRPLGARLLLLCCTCAYIFFFPTKGHVKFFLPETIVESFSASDGVKLQRIYCSFSKNPMCGAFCLDPKFISIILK